MVGAAGTGKTALAAALSCELAATAVGDPIGEFHGRHGRAPHAEELIALATERRQRIDAEGDALAVADGTALTIAIEAELLGHADAGLLRDALRDHARYAATLLLAADLRAPGIDAAARRRADVLLRRALAAAGVPYAVIGGPAEARLAAAHAAIAAALREAPRGPRWRHVCAECGDPDCERHLLARSRG